MTLMQKQVAMKFQKSILLFISLFMAASFFTGNAEAMGRKPKPFQIEVAVDFGPAGKPAHTETIYVEKNTTPKEAVSQIFPILSGKTCCSFREIMAIDGVKVDPAKNRWWTCAVNGSKKVSPQKKKLKAGDKVEWKYSADEQ